MCVNRLDITRLHVLKLTSPKNLRPKGKRKKMEEVMEVKEVVEQKQMKVVMEVKEEVKKKQMKGGNRGEGGSGTQPKGKEATRTRKHSERIIKKEVG